MISVAKYISRYLSKKNVKFVPIFQGGAIMNLINEIGNNKKIKYYCPYHEQALSMQIDSMARLGTITAGMVTSGPGATNLLTGILCSYYDSIPGIYFTGQVGQYHIQKKNTVRQRGFQETDVVSIYKTATKFCVQLKKAEDIKYILDKAFYLTSNGRPGPCLIDIPYNLQITKINPKKLKSFKQPKQKKKNNYNQIKKLIIENEKILIIAGGGIRLSNTIKEFNNFIIKNKIPFVTTWPAQDITDHNNKFYFGSIGRHAYKSANLLAEKANLIITFGVRFSPKIIMNNFAKNAKIISVDVDQNELDFSLKKIDLKINEDLKIFFKNFLNNNKIKISKKWMEECKLIKRNYFNKNFVTFKYKNLFTDPYKFFKIFSEFTPKNSIIFTDAGCNLCWCMQSFKIKYGQRLLSAWGNSPMGYSVAASVGAEIIGKKNVFSFIGDGSLLINLQELHFIKENNISSKIIVLDNKVFGNTQIGSKETFGNSGYGNDEKHGYYAPDIKKISKCYDFDYFFIKNNSMISKKINEFMCSKKRSILHVNISPNQEIIDYSKE